MIFVGDPSSGQLATLELSNPSEARALANFSPRDVIDFFKTTVTSFYLTGNKLTVMYDRNKSTSYELTGGSRDFHLESDGHDGTELVGVPREDASHHFV